MPVIVSVHLREVLAAARMSVAALSRETGIQEAALRRFVTGAEFPHVVGAVLVAQALKRPVEEIWEVKP